MEKIKWGILGCAKIAIDKVIPAMQNGKYSEIAAISSRDIKKSETVAKSLNIPKFYGSYEELLNDKEIDAVYIPLPNHIHLEWCIKAMEAGKHVLCEKPIVLTTDDVRTLIDVRNKTGVKISEAFMVRTHPRWIKSKSLINNVDFGELKAIHGFFSYYNIDGNNIRNIKEYGGGSIWDIGCYPINTSRFLFNQEPTKVISVIENDPKFKVDILASAILQFPSGQSIFTSATQLAPFQRMTAFGTKSTLELDLPFNAPIDKKTSIYIGDEVIDIDICDQYQIQGDSFSEAILNNSEVSVTLEDSFYNTATIEAIFKSANSGKWEELEKL
ncbi:MAG: Gfo/Idh/MocA family oxidoreductase [Spirochaetaceae bacterium]